MLRDVASEIIFLQAFFDFLIQPLFYFLKLAALFEPYIQVHQQIPQVPPAAAYAQTL